MSSGWTLRSHVFSTTHGSAFINHNSPNFPLMMIVIMVMTADSRAFGTQERKLRKTGGRKPLANVSYKEKKARQR